MANFLYRLGHFSARRAGAVITFWLVALLAAVGAFLTFGGSLTTSFDIPGTPTAAVTDKLAKELPGAGGATATVVFGTENGKPLTAEQRREIGSLLTGLERVDGVADAIDPFTAERQRAGQAERLADGSAQIASAGNRLDQGQKRLDGARAQLTAAIDRAKATGTYDADRFGAQQRQLQAQQAKLDDGRAKLTAQAGQLTLGRQLVSYAQEIRTVSAGGGAAIGVVQFDKDLLNVPQEARDQVQKKLEAATIAGVQIDYSTEISQQTEGIIGAGEVVGVVIAAIVLLLMLGTVLGAVLPLVSSLIGVGVGVAGAMAFSGVVDMSSVTPVLGVMLGLAVGIDYALFIINRHRRQLRAGMDVRESIGLANGTAGNAVVFAGTTVLVALLALNTTGIPFLGLMGNVGATCVAVAVLIAISLTPALLRIAGMRVLSKRTRAQAGGAQAGRAQTGRSDGQEAEAVAKPMGTGRSVLTIVGTVAALLVVAIPALSMRLGFPDGSQEAQDSSPYRAHMTVVEEFGAGQNGPLLVVAELDEGVDKAGVLTTQARIASTLMDQKGVVAVAPAGVNAARDYFAFQVVPTEGSTSVSTENLVHSLRDLPPIDDGITLGVAGSATGNIDISEKLADALPIYLAVVVGLSLLIMVVVFRSLLVPILATGGFILSLFAALGGITAIFQWGWLGGLFGVHDPGPILNFVPVVVVGVLFGLAMDYQLFLGSGMREAYAHGADARSAVVAGVRSGRAVVTAAAIIMVSVFGGFVFSHLAMIRPVGFGLAFGVLLDAFVVRMLLIPALMSLFGKAAWWLPRWLDRLLPNVDVEGAELERSHPVPGLHPGAPAGSDELIEAGKST